MTKRKPAALNYPDMPDEYKYIWHWYISIANSGEVSLASIESYARLMCIDIKPNEVEMLLDFDLAAKKVKHNHIKRATQNG